MKDEYKVSNWKIQQEEDTWRRVSLSNFILFIHLSLCVCVYFGGESSVLTKKNQKISVHLKKKTNSLRPWKMLKVTVPYYSSSFTELLR